MNLMTREEALRVKLDALRDEHRAIDQMVRELDSEVSDQLTLRRLKKRKLFLKDAIARLEDQIYPDIIA